MSLNAPRHVAQLTAGTRFPNGKPSGPFDCSVASGVMALDAYSGGGLVPSTTAFRAAQNDQDTNGIGLDDIAVAWHRYGQRFTYGARTWGAVMARLRAGDGVVVQGNYLSLGKWRAPGSRFAGGHAMYLQRTAPGGIVVDDPLRSGAVVLPESAVQRFYLTGLALAGWGAGSYAGGGGAVGIPASSTTPADESATVPVRSWFLTRAKYSPDKPLTAGMVGAWAQDLVELRGTGGSSPYFPWWGGGSADELRAMENKTKAALVATLTPYVNNTVGSLPESLTVTVPGKFVATDPITGVAQAIAALPGALVNGAAHVGLLGGIVVLGLLGVYLTFRESIGMILPGGRRA